METTLDLDTEQVVARFKQGQLTEAELRHALGRSQPAAKRQDLLYLQATNTSVTASLLGLSLVQGGQVVGPVTGAAEWPYANVLEAMRAGWRVIKFPELALLLVEDRTISLGCEFILEKWS